MLKILILSISILIFTACTNPNNRVFNNNLYTLNVAELSKDHSLYTYTSSANPSQNIFVEKQSLYDKNLDKFKQEWINKEKQYRKNDCEIQSKQYENINYYLCSFNNIDKKVIYLLTSNKDKSFGVAKVLILNAKTLPLNQEQELAKQLDKFDIN